MMTSSSLELLKELGLGAMVAELKKQMEDPSAYANLGFEERLGLMVDAEWNRRQANKLTRFVHNAKFSLPNAVVEDIEYFEDRHPDTKAIYLHLDSDYAGRRGAAGFITVLGDRYDVRYLPPKYGKDYNDYLMHLKLLAANDIVTAEDLQHFTENIGTRFKALAYERAKQRNRLRRMHDSTAMQPTKEIIYDLTAQMAELRQQMKLCEDIAERCGVIEMVVNEIERGQIAEKKKSAEKKKCEKGIDI